MRLGAAGRTHGVLRVLDVARHLLDLRILRVLRSVVDRDAVVGVRDLAVEERLVVVRIEPRQRAGNERRVELLAVLERFQRLRAVDHDLVVGVDELAAERPDEPVAPQAVPRGVAERHATRRALPCDSLRHLEEVVGRRREGVEAGRLQHAFPVDHHRAGGAERDADPLLAIRPEVGLARGIPSAVLLAEVFGEVGDVEQLVRIEVGVVVGRQDDVRTGAGVGRHRRLRAHVLPALVVDANFDARLLGELLDVGHVGVDVALDEPAPAQNAQLGVLLRLEGDVLRARERREQRRAGAHPGDGGGTRRAFEELAAVERGIAHRGVSCLRGSLSKSSESLRRRCVAILRRRGARRCRRRRGARGRGRA